MSDASLDRANAIAASLPVDFTEADAMALFAVFSLRYGWAGEFFTREDAREEWEVQTGDRDWEGDPPPFDDAAWERVRSTADWRKVLGQSDDGDWLALSDAVFEAMKERD